MKHACHLKHALLSTVFLFSILYASAQYNEKYRDQYHFSPNSGWVGDPDGLFKLNGVYHLYWWGHSTSGDMIHWTDQPYPVTGDPGDNMGINTGSSVLDKNNVAGFGANAVIGFHTISNGHTQGVGISSSLDNGYRYDLYGSNPILPTTGFSNNDDFRDPQVFWHAPTNKWILIIARGPYKKISFYKSDDLKTWTWASDFGPSGGYSGDNWETPDLFPLPVDGNISNMKWVLTVGVYPGSSDTVREVYHIGNFDGTTFTSDNPNTELRLDNGRDFYAARTWRDYDSANQTRRTLLGWMGCWSYAGIAPSQQTYKGKGILALPRDLSLQTFPEGVRLVQTPIQGLQSLRRTATTFTNKAITGTNNISTYGSFVPAKNVYEFDATFTVNTSATFGFNLCVDNNVNRKCIVKYNGATSVLTIDRSNCSDATLNSIFLLPVSAAVPPENGKLRLHVYVDQSSVEVFTNKGKVVLSTLTYPGTSQTGLELFSSNGTTTLDSFTGWMLDSVWNSANGYHIENHAIYKLVNRDNGKVLDAPSENTNNGAQIQQWDDLGGTNQHWQVDSLDPDNYRITSMSTGKVIDLDAGSTANGAKIQEWDWANNVNQKWRIEDAGGAYFKVTNTSSGKNMEVENAYDDNGRKVQQWKFLAYPHQEWKFVKVGMGSPMRVANSIPKISKDTSGNKTDHFFIYPNPVKNSLVTVSAKSAGVLNTQQPPGIHCIILLNTSGTVLKEFLDLGGCNRYQINIKGFSNQLYFIKIYDGNKWESHKVEVMY